MFDTMEARLSEYPSTSLRSGESNGLLQHSLAILPGTPENQACWLIFLDEAVYQLELFTCHGSSIEY